MTSYRFVNPAAGVPDSSPTHGSLGWSSVALLLGQGNVIVVDTGGPGYRARWDAWLDAEGLTRHDVTTVLLTHCHWDHLGAAAWFPRATIGVGRAELAWAQANASTDPYLEPGLLATVRASQRLHLLEDGDEVDGVRAMATFGHTPGHLSYAVSTADSPVLVVGDAVKNGRELAGGPFDLTASPADSAASRDRIRGLAAEGHRLLLGHDSVYGPDLQPIGGDPR
jgi:N-acyl homoserine lactone hydrolase